MRTNDDLRALYQRADFVKFERGKFYEEVANGASVLPDDTESAKPSEQSKPANDAPGATRLRAPSR
jgi:hypothetical protein